MNTEFKIRDVALDDVPACTDVRGKTRDNPASAEFLVSIGFSNENTQQLLMDGKMIGSVSEFQEKVVGFCYADPESGEIIVLALLPEHEGKGVGKALLQDVVSKMRVLGHNRLWLAASPDPNVRAHGFYRHLGWVFTGKVDEIRDQILELTF